MNKKIYQKIDDITLNVDEKTIEQRVMKLTEEVGELAQKILIYEKVHGTTYKTATKEDIIEEIADVLIVAMSVGSHYYFTHDRLKEKIFEKIAKWEKVLKHDESDF